MKTVLKYLFAGFLLIAILGLGFLQIIQIIDMGNVKKSIADLKIQVNSCSGCNAITPLPMITETASTTVAPDDTTFPTQTMTVKLYYKNYDLDPEVNNCEADSYVERTIQKTSTPLTETIKLLLKNDLTQAEKNDGLETVFNTTPASKQLTLTSANIVNGVATLKFSDPMNFTSNGSCGSGILASQVALTAKQFPSVTSVEFLPNTVFQP